MPLWLGLVVSVLIVLVIFMAVILSLGWLVDKIADLVAGFIIRHLLREKGVDS